MITKKMKKFESSGQKWLASVSGKPLSLGILLKSIREGEGWSMAEMAEQLGVTRGYISNIEKGKAVSPETAARYAKMLGYSERQFVRLALQDQIVRAGLHYKIQLRG